jgi:hypothetical protein
MLTDGDRRFVARRLGELIHPYGVVDASRHIWMPKGFAQPQEAKIGETDGFLSAEHQEGATSWWLVHRERANTPNWDIACTATIDGREGLILVEAKAHCSELHVEGKPPGNADNDRRIRDAIREADMGLNAILPGWHLTADSHYQLCNRFAWSWKIATLGIPVILVYLGFLNANEMADIGQPFRSTDEWVNAVRDHARSVVPENAWERSLDIDGTPARALIRALDLGRID